MGREPHNGRALALAQLARRAAHIIALGGRADHHRAAAWCGGVAGLRAGQHYHHRPGGVVGQHIRIAQIVRA